MKNTYKDCLEVTQDVSKIFDETKYHASVASEAIHVQDTGI